MAWCLQPFAMSNVEVIIVLLLLFMAVPDGCRKVGRPALASSVFILCGLLLGPIIKADVITMLKQAGQVGFLLLLFEVGLEIDLPRLREFFPALRFAAIWSFAQYLVVIPLGLLAGLDPVQAALAAAALAGCSVGMAHAVWKDLPMAQPENKQAVLHRMVALEMLSIVMMAAGSAALTSGFSVSMALRLLGIGAVIVLLSQFAPHLSATFQTILSRTTHWRLHWLVLLILVICALGNRLGLDAPKTAFFLGLVLSRTRHDGLDLEAHIAPISQRFLIPLFFFSLGLNLNWSMFWGLPAALALGTALLLLGSREILNRRWFHFVGEKPVFLLYSPNLTLCALAASAVLEHGHANSAAAWLLIAGLLVTIPSILMTPGADAPVKSQA
jgi:Kef-type K+ transport system membrane component KefB